MSYLSDYSSQKVISFFETQSMLVEIVEEIVLHHVLQRIGSSTNSGRKIFSDSADEL